VAGSISVYPPRDFLPCGGTGPAEQGPARACASFAVECDSPTIKLLLDTHTFCW
jgi:hypothetical protein